MAEIRDENGRKERHYLFFDGESVNGKVRCTVFNKCTFRTGKDNGNLSRTFKEDIHYNF